MKMNIAKKMKEHGLFAAPLNNGDWMIGKANVVYHLDIRKDHYKDTRLTIASTLPKAIQKWINRRIKERNLNNGNKKENHRIAQEHRA